jgi:DNA topoisomerase-1
VRPYLSRDLFVLYKLIWERFTASQMAPARFWDTTVICEAGRTQWRTKGERLIFPGFLRIYTPDEQMQDVEVPPVSQGEELSLQRLSKEQKFTQPPARFSEASLVRKLEELDIGRPSTYAQIISTLRDRHYVEMEKRQFVPTELGYTVNDLLVSHFGNFMDSGFTARMEENLDRIASGEQEWQQVLREFSRIFYPVLDRASKEMEQVKTGKETGLTCEQCGRPLVIKFGRNGAFLACSGYPQCKYTSDFERHGNGEIHPVDNREELVKVGECPKCSSDLVIKKARNRSRFIACSNYPQCKHSEPLGTGVDCPEQGCSGELVEKGSKRGKIFYGCNRFPQCSYAVWNPPVDEPCPECESPFLVSRSTKSRGEHLACPSKSCRYWKQLDSAPAVRAGRVKKREERN